MTTEVLVICFSHLSRDPRVYKHIQALKQLGVRITTCGFSAPQYDDVSFIPCKGFSKSSWVEKSRKGYRLATKKYDEIYWDLPSVKDAWEKLNNKQFDIIIANDLNTLPLAIKLKKNTKLLFDAHEYFPQESSNWKWKLQWGRYIDWMCKKYLSTPDAMVTVSESIAKEYLSQYTVSPHVVLNTPPYEKLSPNGGNKKSIRIVTHGMCLPHRNIEMIIELANYLDDRFSIDLMLVPSNERYYRKICKLVQNKKKVRLIPPVQMDKVVQQINQYDIGLYCLPPKSMNDRFALPNKFFEFIQARLAVVVGPSLEMGEFVQKWQCGFVCDQLTPHYLAKQLNAISLEQIRDYKDQSDQLAEEYCAEKDIAKLVSLLKELS